MSLIKRMKGFFGASVQSSNPKANVWIRYFSDKARESKDGFKGQQQLEPFYERGKIQGYPKHEITKQIIEGEKAQTVLLNLSEYFALSQHLRPEIFEMCKTMFTQKADPQKVVDSCYVTLMRTFIIFAHQLDHNKFDRVLQGQEVPHNFERCLDNFHFLVNALLMAKREVRSDFLFLFNDVTSVYFSVAERIIPAKENCMSKSIFNLANVFGDFLQKINANEKCQPSDTEPLDAVYQFVFQFFWHWMKSGETKAFIEFGGVCWTLATNPQVTIRCSGTAYKWIFPTIKMALEKVQEFEASVEMGQVCFRATKLLAELMPIDSERVKEDWDVMATMETVLQWMDKVEPLDFGEVDETLEYQREMTRDWKIMFITDDFISSELSIGEFDVTGKVYPLITETALTTYNIVFLLKDMCLKVPNLRRQFIEDVSRQESRRMQYLTVTMLSLFSLPDPTLQNDLERHWCSLINRFAFHRSVEANPLRANLRELTLHFVVNCWKSFDKENIILDGFSELLSPLDPQTVSYCVKFFGFLLRMDHDKFMEAVKSSKIVDGLIRCYFVYLNWQISGERDEFIKEIRGQILAFFVEMACDTIILLFIFQNEQRSMFAISLAFENVSEPFGIDILKKGLQQTKSIGLMKCLTKVIAKGLEFLRDNVRWQNFIRGVIRDSILHAITSNYNNIVDSFLHVGDYAPVAIFAKIPLASKGSGQEEDFIIGVLEMFKSLCSKSRVMLLAIMNESWHFKESLIEGIKSVEFTDTIFLSVLSFVFNMKVTSLSMLKENNDLFIWNVAALEILFTLCIGGKYEKDTLALLFAVCRNNLANRFQCYEAGLLTKLIGLEDDYAINLVSLVGTYFLSVHNLSMFLKAINQSNADLAIISLDCLTSMKRSRSALAPSQCFYLGQSDSVLETEQFDMPWKYTIHFSISFTSSVFLAPRQLFLEIVRGEQKISLYITGRDVELEVWQNGQSTVYPLPAQLIVDVWHRFIVSVSTSHIRVFVDEKEIGNVKTPHKMERRLKGAFGFRGPNTYLGSVFLFDNSVTDAHSLSKCEPVVHFAADTKRGEDCTNLRGPSPKATFTGIRMYYLTDISNTIATCGGPNVLLPLIQREDLTEAMLLSFLRFIKELIMKSVDRFRSQDFFRSFGYLFGKIHNDCVTFTVIQALYEIFECLSVDDLKVEMAKFVWGNFDRWFSLDDGLRISIFSGIFGLLIDDPLFRANMSFSDLLLKFAPRLSADQSEEIIDRACKLLHCYGQKEKAMTEEDAYILIGAAMSHKNKGSKVHKLVLHELNLIKDLSLELVPPVTATLKQCNYVTFYNFFLECDSREIIETSLDCIRDVVALKEKLNSDDSDAVMIRALQVLSVESCDTRMVVKLMSMMCESGSWNIQQPATIFYPQFLPLLVKVIQRLDNKSDYVNYLLKSYSDFPLSRKALKSCQYWCFWFLVLFKSCSDESHFDEWMNVIATCVFSLTKETSDFDSEQWFKQLYVFCVILRLDFSRVTLSVFRTLSELGFNLKLVALLCHFLIYMPTQPCHEDLQSTFIDDMIQSICESAEEEKLVFDPKPIMTNEIDLDLAMAAVKYLMKSENADHLVRKLGQTNVDFFTLCTLFIHRVSQADPDKVSGMVDLFVSVSQTLSQRISIAPATFIMLKHFSFDPGMKERLLECVGADSFQQFSEENARIYDTIVSQLNEYTRDLFAMIWNNGISQERSSFVAALRDSQKDYRVLNDCVVGYCERVTDGQYDEQRQRLGNQKSWELILSRLQDQCGSPWSTVSNITHFKFASSLDSTGRRSHMQGNRHFLDHLDASEARDGSTVDGPVRLLEKISETLAPSETDAQTGRISFAARCSRITDRATSIGQLYIHETDVIFEATCIRHYENSELTAVKQATEIRIRNMFMVLRRRYMHEDLAVELFMNDGKSYFFTFRDTAVRNKLIDEIKRVNCSPKLIQDTNDINPIYKALKLRGRWSNGDITNFEYLWWLNMLSGRSIHDISQYPVMPWVLSNYTGYDLDLDDPSNYRDLGVSVVAMNKIRLDEMLAKYEDVKGTDEACLCRWAYSNSSYTTNYLVRVEPFTSLHIALQGGRFDVPERIFKSIREYWDNLNSESAFFLELVPEFFTTPEFLINSERFQFGGDVDHVEIPPWARNAAEFIILNRRAMESSYVSANLHKWIDLIFGYQQSGPASFTANNAFHPYFYHTAIKDPKNAEIIEMVKDQAFRFGIIPGQLFTTPHPARTFVPVKYCLENINFREIMSASGTPVAFSINGGSLQVLFSDGSLKVFEGGTVKHARGSIWLMQAENRYCRFMGKYIVCVRPLYRCAFVFDGDSLWQSPMHESSICAVDVTSNYFDDLLVTGSLDSSIRVTDIRKKKQTLCLVAHEHPTVDLSCCIDLNMIASIDTANVLVLVDLFKGRFIRRIQLDRAAKAKHVWLFREGVIVVAFEDKTEELAQTKLVSMDLAGRQLGDVTFQGATVCHCIVEMSDYSCHLCLVQNTCCVYILRDYDLKTVGQGVFPGVPCAAAYSRQTGQLVVASTDGTFAEVQFRPT